MSIVPYYSDRNTRVVYHDLDHQIVVVHNHQDNSFSLYHDRLRYSQPRGPVSAGGETGQAEIFCPNCGVGLLDFLQGHRSSTRRRTSNKTSSRRNERPTGVFLGVSLDYFKLLAQVGNSAALGAPGDEQTTNADLFNQGYFERFFKKVLPVVLGSGARAQVYKVVHVLKNIQLGVFAVKRINVGDHSQYLDHVLNEALILYELSVRGANEHNLIRYNHVWMETGELADLSTILLGREGAPPRSSDAVVPYVYILQQYCDGGHLENMISRTFQREATMLSKERVEMERARRRRCKTLDPLPPPPEKRWLRDVEVWKFFRDIANGVLYLHAHGILHRDLKPSNCLLESRYELSAIAQARRFASQRDLDAALARLPRVLVSDFGEGKFIDKSPSGPADDRCGNTGTVEFTDPKLWVYAAADRPTQGKRKFAHRFSYDCDIYSLGMILCYLCVGVLPFADILTNTNDPEAIRRDISDWHDALSAQSFHDWFSRRCVLVYGRSPASMGDFEILIFMMIK
ncbi:kinase-like protein, partial [Metschnikowia bicuspidata]